jgi:hypothetical protein
MIKNGIKFIGIALQFNNSSLEEIDSARESFSFGVLRLQKGFKEIVLDSASSTLEEDYTILVYLKEQDEDLNPDENFTQDLEDLEGLDLAEFYIGDDCDIYPDTMTLFVEQNGTTKAVELKRE